MKKPKYAKRVHIVPVGFDIDRAYMPLIEMEADKVYLFAEKTERSEIIRHFIAEIRKNLDEKSNSIDVEECGWNLENIGLYTTLREYRKIIDKESGNNIFINVSTGSKIHAIAGMIASMIFRDEIRSITPYYVEPENYPESPTNKDQYSIGCKEIKTLPNYRIEKPPDEIIDVLAIIDKIEHNESGENKGKPVTKKILIEKLEENGILLTTVSEKDSKNDAGKYNALQRKYLKPLSDWGYIQMDTRSKRPRIEVTEEGRNALMFLRD